MHRLPKFLARQPYVQPAQNMDALQDRVVPRVSTFSVLAPPAHDAALLRVPRQNTQRYPSHRDTRPLPNMACRMCFDAPFRPNAGDLRRCPTKICLQIFRQVSSNRRTLLLRCEHASTQCQSPSSNVWLPKVTSRTRQTVRGPPLLAPRHIENPALQAQPPLLARATSVADLSQRSKYQHDPSQSQNASCFAY